MKDSQIQETIRNICVDESKELALQVRKILSGEEVQLSYEKGLDEVVDRFEREVFDLMLLTSSVASRRPGETLEIIDLIYLICPGTQVLFFAYPGRLKLAHQALRAGVYHYSFLPISDEAVSG